MDQAKPLGPLFRLSLVLAGTSFLAGLLALSGVTGNVRFPGQGLLLAVSFGLSIGWIIALVVGVITRRRRGLWLLVGLPLALAWPALIADLALPALIGGIPGTRYLSLASPLAVQSIMYGVPGFELISLASSIRP